MQIYTISQLQLYTIKPEVQDVQYVEGIPYSLQMKCNIPRNITVRYYKGNPCVYFGRTAIYDEKAKKIVKILNGYAKENNKVLFRK
jgi:hypothetical protein